MKNMYYSGVQMQGAKGLEKAVVWLLFYRVFKVQKKEEKNNGWDFPRLDYYLRVPPGDTLADTVEAFTGFVETDLPPGLSTFFFHPNYYETELKDATLKWKHRVFEAELFGEAAGATVLNKPVFIETNWRHLMCRWNCQPCASDTDPWVKPARCP